MNSNVHLRFALLLGSGLICGSTGTVSLGQPIPMPATRPPPQPAVLRWWSLTFTNGKHSPTFYVSVGNVAGDASQGLRLEIMDIPPGRFKTNDFSARVYHSDGTSVTPIWQKTALSKGTVHLLPGAPVPQATAYFPWDTNAVRDSWVKVVLGRDRYWMGVPYEFAQNPRGPCRRLGGRPPQAVLALQSWTAHDHVLLWECRGLFAASPTGADLGESPLLPGALDEPQLAVPHWERLTFPEAPPFGKNCPLFSVSCGVFPGDAARGLRLDIHGLTWGFFKRNVIRARLYQPNRTSLGPIPEEAAMLNAPGFAGSLPPGMIPPAQVMTHFPWGKNSLEESWIKVEMGAERYWLEIPYGLDRNPQDPLPPQIQAGPPGFVPVMNVLTAHDHVLRWQTVQYDLGPIQNGWQLSLWQSNPFKPESQVVLYHDPGQSPWNVQSPRTTVRVRDADGTVIEGRCLNIHLNDDGLRRTDTFALGRNGDNGRGWGQIEIGIDDKTYRVVVPSSLYKYTHGHAASH